MFKKAKFSLVELMVVVAVLAVMSSLFIPSLSKALRISQGLNCLEHQKLIGQAVSLYLEDSTRFPIFRQTSSKGKDPTRWHSVFWDDLLGMGYDGRNLTQEQADKWLLEGEELAGSDMYACPLDDGDLRVMSMPSRFKGFIRGQKYGRARSYSLNSYRSWNGWRDELKEGISGISYQTISGPNVFLPWSQSQHKIPAPSEMFLVAESPGTGYVGGGGSALRSSPFEQDGNGDVKYFNSVGVNVPDFTNVRYHNGGWNYLFVDGHVENMLPEDTLATDGQMNNPKGGYWTSNPND